MQNSTRVQQPQVSVFDRRFQNPTLLNTFPVGNCGTDQRKRGREQEEEKDEDMNQFISNAYKKQSHFNQQLMDVSTGLQLAFNDNHQHQQQQRSFNHHPYGFMSMLSQDLSNIINQEEAEIDRYLHAQGEEVRRKLAEKTQRHYHALMMAAKESGLRIIKEKEAVVEKAARRNAELEARATQLSAEAQVWEAKAKAQEAVAAALQVELRRQTVVVGGGGCVSQGEVVAGGGDVEDAESSYVDPERVVVVRGPGCKACGKRVASVVLLPCRHLCVCSECDDVVQTCPLCLSFRSSSIEVYMS